VKADVAARLHHANELLNEEAEVVKELVVSLAISHVSRAVAVRVQRGERRREDGISDGVIGDSLKDFHAIAVIGGVSVGDDLVDAVHRNEGTLICLVELYGFD